MRAVRYEQYRVSAQSIQLINLLEVNKPGASSRIRAYGTIYTNDDRQVCKIFKLRAASELDYQDKVWDILLATRSLLHQTYSETEYCLISLMIVETKYEDISK